MEMLKSMLAGAIMVSAWAISVFFFRFWRKTGDRLFGLFSASFLLLGLERINRRGTGDFGHLLYAIATLECWCRTFIDVPGVEQTSYLLPTDL